MIATELDHNRLQVLSDAACRQLLAGQHIGRIAVHSQALPAIFPVNYVVHDGAIVFRTNPGSKLAAATTGAVVAFEIDEVDALFHSGWSVLVVGVASEITDPAELAAARKLPLRPWGVNVAGHYVRIDIHRLTGRRIDTVS